MSDEADIVGSLPVVSLFKPGVKPPPNKKTSSELRKTSLSISEIQTNAQKCCDSL
jgi:hypothetical protein